jgi:hypothetical protein
MSCRPLPLQEGGELRWPWQSGKVGTKGFDRSSTTARMEIAKSNEVGSLPATYGLQ